VVVAVGPGVDGALLGRCVGSVVAGLEGLGVEGTVVVCFDGPGVSEEVGSLGLSFGASVPVEVWSSAVSLGRYGVDRVVCEMLEGRGYEWVVA
jgi:hypothetical protein